MFARLLEDSPPARRRLLVIVAVAAALLRVLYVAEVHDHPYWRTPLVDAADFHGRAQDVARGAGLGPEVYYKAPAYPFLVGQVYRLAGPHLEVVYVLQMLGGVVTALLAAVLGLRWLGPAAGLAGGLVTGLYPWLPYFENQLLIESSALFFSVVAVFLVFGSRAPAGSIALDLLGGVAAGLALQLRPVNATLVAAVLLALLLGRAARSVRLRRATCVVVPVLLLLVPTMRHNRLATGRIVPISVNGGINFFIGNNPDYDTTVAIRPGLRWEELTQRFGAPDDPVRWQENYYRASVDFARQEPGEFLALLAKKCVLFWNRREIDRNQDSSAMMGDSRVLGLDPVRWSLFAPLGLVGLVVLRRSWRQLPLHAVFVLQMLGVVAFFVTSRYRLAVVPWLGIAAGAAVVSMVAAARRRPRALAPLGLGLAAAGLLVLPDWYGLGAHDFGRPDFDWAEVLARRGDREGALRAYERAAARHPDDPDVLFRYGEHLRRFGRTDSAVAEFERAAALAPWSYKLPLAIGAARLETGDLEAAWRALEAAESRGDPYGRALYDMGLVRERQGRYDEALELYRRSLERRDSSEERVARRLGAARCLILLGRPEPAEIEFTAAESETSEPARIHIERAETWIRAGDPVRAAQGLRRWPEAARDPRAQYTLSRALAESGNRAEALAAARRAATLDSQSDRYRNWVALLETDSRADSGSTRP